MPTSDQRYQFVEADKNVAFEFWLGEPGPRGARPVLATIIDLDDPIALFPVVRFPGIDQLPSDDRDADRLATIYCQALPDDF